MNKGVVLVLETTQGNGSLALFADGKPLVSLEGKPGDFISRDLMGLVSEALKIGSVKKKQFEKIIVSTGPGSATGRRVGESLAKGLSTALGIVYCQVSILESLRLFCQRHFSNKDDNFLCVLEVGRGQLGVTLFRNDELVKVDQKEIIFCRVEDFEVFLKRIGEIGRFVLVVPELQAGFLESVGIGDLVNGEKVCKPKGSFAEIIGYAWLS